MAFNYGYSTLTVWQTVARGGAQADVDLTLWTTENVAPAIHTVDMPLWTTEAEGATRSGSASTQLTVWRVSATGKAYELGTASTHIPLWSTIAYGLSARGSASTHIPVWQTLARGRAIEAGSISVYLPLWRTSATGTVQGHGTVAKTMPLWTTEAFGHSIPVTILYRGVVVNTSNYAVTEYTDFNFNSFGYLNDKYIGANSSGIGTNGIYELGGKTDNGTSIKSQIEWPVEDFGLDILKYAREAWVGYRADGQLQLYIVLGEHDEWTSNLTHIHDRMHEERVKIARGIKERFLSFGLKNREGASFDIDSLRILVDPIQRRNR